MFYFIFYMNRYSKFSSTLIKNWLLKNGCNLSNEASTSESMYFKYGETKIRLSYHVPSSGSANSIYIMIPVNNTHSFGVFVGKQYCAISNVKALKSFLNSLFLILDVKAFNELAKINIDSKKIESEADSIVQKDKKIKELENKIGNLKIQIKDQKTRIDNQTTELRRLHAICSNSKST